MSIPEEPVTAIPGATMHEQNDIEVQREWVIRHCESLAEHSEFAPDGWQELADLAKKTWQIEPHIVEEPLTVSHVIEIAVACDSVPGCTSPAMFECFNCGAAMCSAHSSPTMTGETVCLECPDFPGKVHVCEHGHPGCVMPADHEPSECHDPEMIEAYESHARADDYSLLVESAIALRDDFCAMVDGEDRAMAYKLLQTVVQALELARHGDPLGSISANVVAPPREPEPQ